MGVVLARAEWRGRAVVWALVAPASLACAPQSGRGGAESPGAAARAGQPRSSVPKPIAAAIRGDPKATYHKLNVGNNFIGAQQVER